MNHGQFRLTVAANPAHHSRSSEIRSLAYPGESFSLEAMLGWTKTVMTQEGSPLNMIKMMLSGSKDLESAHRHLPLIESDKVAVGKRVPWWREWLEHNEPGDEWWNRCNFSRTVSEVTVPDYIGGGWFDIFLPQTLRDYQTLKHAGRQPYLHIGPWAHTDLPYMVLSVKEAITWFCAQMLGDRSGLRDMPVRIYVMGANEWRDLPEWPPANARAQRWYLQPGRALSLDKPPASEPDRYRYDPADPTPGVGGAALSQNKGPRDQRALEARPGVLVYTSPVLDHDLEIIGPVQAELFVQSSLEHTDFFARLCDVNPAGKSINICDSLVRLVPGRPPRNPDGTLSVCVELWPTAYRFKRGHRIRLQVSSGAHPRLARNLGSGEPLATATTVQVAEQQVFHDPVRPSAVVLPVQT